MRGVYRDKQSIIIEDAGQRSNLKQLERLRRMAKPEIKFKFKSIPPRIKEMKRKCSPVRTEEEEEVHKNGIQARVKSLVHKPKHQSKHSSRGNYHGGVWRITTRWYIQDTLELPFTQSEVGLATTVTQGIHHIKCVQYPDWTREGQHGKDMVDYICNYLDNIHERRVVSKAEPGYLSPLLPKEAPQRAEPWNTIMKDIDEKIMPGITHWQHPRFHAYFPSGNSYASILADMLSDAIGCIGFSWAASPACTELETIVLDWFGKALDLPSEFLFYSSGSRGGGVLQSSASECILVSMLAARTEALKYLMKIDGAEEGTESKYLPKLVAYCSKEAHSCVEKDAMISLVRLRILDPDEDGSLRGGILEEAVKKDIEAGLHPFFILATLGTTGICSFDNLTELGEIAKSLPACWFHVDGAYAGSGFICPENRYLMEGIHYADSFNTNCNKWLMMCYDCSCLWVKDRMKLTSALTVDPLYLQHENSRVAIDYRHWCIPLSRRFRSLKLWFTLRNYGVEGLQNYIRNHCRLARYFEKLVLNDNRFEVCNEVRLGLVCFRLKGSDVLNQELLSSINSSGEAHMIPCTSKGKYVIRFCVVYEHSTHEHIEQSWNVIQNHATAVLESHKIVNGDAKQDVKQPRKLSRMHSFTRSVSRELYEKRNSRNSLHDGATPIVVPEDDINSNNLKGMEDVFTD